LNIGRRGEGNCPCPRHDDHIRGGGTALFISAPIGSDWSTSYSTALPQGENSGTYPSNRKLGGPQNCSRRCERSNSCLCWDSNPGFFSRLRSHYTDSVIAASIEY